MHTDVGALQREPLNFWTQKTNGWTKQMGEDNREEADVSNWWNPGCRSSWLVQFTCAAFWRTVQPSAHITNAYSLASWTVQKRGPCWKHTMGAGIVWGRWAWAAPRARAGGEGNIMGISSSGLEKRGKEEMLAEPSCVAGLPEKESISQASGGIRGGFQQLAPAAGSTCPANGESAHQQGQEWVVSWILWAGQRVTQQVGWALNGSPTLAHRSRARLAVGRQPHVVLIQPVSHGQHFHWQ